MNPISLAPVRAARVILKRIQIHRLSRLSDIAILTVDSVEALEKLRKWEQGDKSLYSIEALEARYKNRTNKEVYRYLSIWWASAMALESQFGSPQATVMSKAVYLTIYIRVSKGLLEAESEGWDEAALAHLVEEAWEEESNGMGHLRRSQFNDSLFELVDMWTNTTEAAEYVDVLRRLHGCCFDGAGSFFSDAAADAAEDDPGGGGPHTLPNMVRGAKGGLHQPREDVILGAKHPSQQERARRSGEHKQRRAAVTIQTSTRKRQATHKLSEKKQAVTSIQARTRVGAVRTANLVQRVDESEMWRQWRSGNDGQQAIMSWSDRAEAGRKRDDAYNRSFGPRDADPQPPFTEEKKRVEVRRGEDCGKQGQLQYWALRKGLPPRLQEAFDELSEKDQVAVAHLSEEKQLKFLRDGLTDKGVPNDVVAARGMLDQHLRAQFNDLSRADQGALAKLSAEKLVLYLGGAAVQTSPAPRRPPAATPAADLQPISSPASPARELDLVHRDDLERRAYERANVRRYHEQSLWKSGEDGALQDHCGGHARARAALGRGIGIGSGGGVGFRGGKGIRGSSEVPEDWRVSTVGTLGYMYAHQQCGQASAMACARVQTRDGARDGASPRLGARDGASFSPRSPPPSREIPTALCARDGAVPARELLQIYFPTALGALKLSPQPSEHPSFPHSPRSTQAFPTALGAPKLTLQANRALPSSSPSATAMAHEKKNHAWLLRKGARIGRPGGWIGVTAPLVRMESAHLASAMPSARGMTPRRRLVSAESPSSPHPPHQGTAVPGYTARVLVPPSPWHSTPAYRHTAPHQPGVPFGLPSLPSSPVDSSFEWYVRQSSQKSPFGSAAERIRPGTNHGDVAAPEGSRLARYQRPPCL
jgi:hypothetical protein